MGRKGSASVKFVFVIIVCLNLIIENVESRVLTPTSDRDPREAAYKAFNNQLDTKSKRPFCNAFTGCGKKRSNEVIPPMSQVMDDEGEPSMSDLVELNSEPAIENVMRQIMSEAKMYEALQEANREMYLQKLRHNGLSKGYPSTFSMQ